MAARAVLGAALCALVVAGCGGGSSSTRSTTAPETRQPPAHLPTPWHRHVDPANGLTIGIPPGWRVSHKHGALLVRSADRLVVVSVAAQRSPGALAIPPDRYAREALASLSGYRHKLRPGPVRRFSGTPFDGVRVSARGISKGGVTQLVHLIVLRRDGVANFTLLIASSHAATNADVKRALAMARTLRDRPPAGQPARSGRSG
jgi:hypothetical protein